MVSTPREIRLEGIHATLLIRPRANGVVELRFSGQDIGEFGEAPFDYLDQILQQFPEIALFIDARHARSASIDVSGLWAVWLRKNRERLSRVHMATGSAFLRISADFVRRFAEITDRMQVHTDPDDFERALQQAVN